MIVEEFREKISRNAKLLLKSFIINNEFPETFIIGSQTDSRVTITIDKSNFKKFLKKVDLISLPVKFRIDYYGYGIVGVITDVKDGKKYDVEYKVFAARKATLFNSRYKEIKPGDKEVIEYIAVPYLLLPSLSLDLSKHVEVKEGNIVKLFIIHEYHLNIFTKIKDTELRLARHSWYPNIALPEAEKSNMHHYTDVFEIIKGYFKQNDEKYYHEFRENRVIVEMTADEKPLKLVLVSPYIYNDKISISNKVQKLVKEFGFGNIRRIVNLPPSTKLLEALKETKIVLGEHGYFNAPIKIFVGRTGQLDPKEKYVLRVITGKAIKVGGIETFTVETTKEFKLSGKDLKKRREIKMDLKVPCVGSSVCYDPDNEDIKSLPPIFKGKDEEIYSISQFNEVLERYKVEGIAIKGFEKGLCIFPYVKVELLSNGETLLQQIIPYLYVVKPVSSKKK